MESTYAQTRMLDLEHETQQYQEEARQELFKMDTKLKETRRLHSQEEKVKEDTHEEEVMTLKKVHTPPPAVPWLL